MKLWQIFTFTLFTKIYIRELTLNFKSRDMLPLVNCLWSNLQGDVHSHLFTFFGIITLQLSRFLTFFEQSMDKDYQTYILTEVNVEIIPFIFICSCNFFHKSSYLKCWHLPYILWHFILAKTYYSLSHHNLYNEICSLKYSSYFAPSILIFSLWLLFFNMFVL